MTQNFNRNDRVGWELIFRSEKIPPQYHSEAEPHAQVVALATALPPGGFVLDIGCGMGRHLLYLGKQGFRVAGIDISPTGIRASRATCEKYQIPVDTRISDITTLAWDEMTFDGAFSIAAIHHQQRANLVQSLSEVWRVLKPGGMFMADFPSTDTLVYQKMRRQTADGQLTEVEPNTFVAEGDEFDEGSDEYLPHHFCDEADLRDLFSAFEIIKLVADLRDVVTETATGKVGKWVIWARRPAQ